METDNGASFGRDEARNALKVVSKTRADRANRLTTLWWYHPGLGLIVAALVVALTAPTPIKSLVIVGALLALAALATAYSRVTGLGFSDEYYKLAFPELVVLLAVVLSLMMLVLMVPKPLVALPAALAAFLATVVLGRRAEAAIRRKLRTDEVGEP